MKLARIKAVCKARQTCRILQDPEAGTQWIDNGSAFYKIDSIWLDENSVRAIFEIPMKDWLEKWTHETINVQGMRAENAEMLYDVWAREQEVELTKMPIRYMRHEEIWCFGAPDGRVVYAPAEEFKPLDGNVRYALRRAPGCMPVIAVYRDLLCDGGVMVLPQGAAEEFRRQLMESAKKEVYGYERSEGTL